VVRINQIPRALRRACSISLPAPSPFVRSTLLATLCVLSIVLAAATLALNLRAGIFGFDFHGTIWAPDRAILHGRTPYPAADAAALRRRGNPAIYPPPILLASLPLGLLSVVLAAVVWSALSLAALVAALALTGLRDWRCYALLLATPAVLSMVMLGQMEGMLALGCVVAWRFRDRAVVVGIAVAALIAAKLFLAPIVVWMLVTRRYAAALIAASGALVMCVLAWAVIGFDGMRTYPALLAADTQAFQAGGESLVAVGTRSGLSLAYARPLAVAAGLAVVALAVAVARRSDGDRRAFTVAVVAGIALSPVVWLHYLVVLFVLVALWRRRADLVWAALTLTWLATTEHTSLWRTIATLGVVSCILASCVGRGGWRLRARAGPPVVPCLSSAVAAGVRAPGAS
jgi:alpha-1,2-mannosyltransferase